jgi:hypothetical protein
LGYRHNKFLLVSSSQADTCNCFLLDCNPLHLSFGALGTVGHLDLVGLKSSEGLFPFWSEYATERSLFILRSVSSGSQPVGRSALGFGVVYLIRSHT